MDYERAFSATMRATSFRTLLALSAGRKLRLKQYDVSNAFTQADMDIDTFVEPARGHEVWETIDGKRVCHGMRLCKRAQKRRCGAHQPTDVQHTTWWLRCERASRHYNWTLGRRYGLDRCVVLAGEVR